MFKFTIIDGGPTHYRSPGVSPIAARNFSLPSAATSRKPVIRRSYVANSYRNKQWRTSRDNLLGSTPRRKQIHSWCNGHAGGKSSEGLSRTFKFPTTWGSFKGDLQESFLDTPRNSTFPLSCTSKPLVESDKSRNKAQQRDRYGNRHLCFLLAPV